MVITKRTDENRQRNFCWLVPSVPRLFRVSATRNSHATNPVPNVPSVPGWLNRVVISRHCFSIGEPRECGALGTPAGLRPQQFIGLRLGGNIMKKNAAYVAFEGTPRKSRISAAQLSTAVAIFRSRFAETLSPNRRVDKGFMRVMGQVHHFEFRRRLLDRSFRSMSPHTRPPTCGRAEMGCRSDIRRRGDHISPGKYRNCKRF
jgi:hypothetical protein